MRLFIFLLFLSVNFHSSLYAQTDSLTIIFIGVGPKGEKFKVLQNGEKVFACKSSGSIQYQFKVAKNWPPGQYMNLYVVRKGKFGLFYRDTFLNPYYDDTKAYFVIVRKYKFKNKFAVDFFWDDKIPRLPD